MVVKLGTACGFQLSPPLGTYSPLFTPLSPSRRCRPASPLVCRGDRTAFLGSGATKLFRSRSLGDTALIRRTSSCSSSVSDGSFFYDDSEDEDEFAERLRELAARMEEERSRLGERGEAEEEEDVSGEIVAAAFSSSEGGDHVSPPPFYSAHKPRESLSMVDVAPPRWADAPCMLPEWHHQSSVGHAMASRSGGMSEPSGLPSLTLPSSRLAPRHAQAQLQQQHADEAEDGSTASCCSVKRAFSSVVFIIRELHSHALHLREVIFREDRVEWVLGKVQAEVHASFCWLFQQIFSCTPTLMMSLMLLLANFTVYSMAAGGLGGAVAVAATTGPVVQQAPVVSVEYSLDLGEVIDQGRQNQQQQEQQQQEHDEEETISRDSINGAAGITTFPLSTSSPALTPGGTNDGGGRITRPVAGATDDGHPSHNGDPNSSGRYLAEEEARAWRRIQDEATRLQSEMRHEALVDPDTLRHLVAPVSVPDQGGSGSGSSPVTEYMRTELEYRVAVDSSPDNPLLLANYAQFLFLVARDHDRAEHYFKRATAIEPRDADSLVRYADFLWLARNDICAAEETYLEALEADPGNACHAASYAHFLWNTGGEDTCFPLGGDQYCHQGDDGDDEYATAGEE